MAEDNIFLKETKQERKAKKIAHSKMRIVSPRIKLYLFSQQI